MSESVIYCEGFHDRAFWKGWLTHLGCKDPGVPPAGSSIRQAVVDPWKDSVKGGQFAYHSPGGRFIRVIPCQGKSNILPAAKTRLLQRSTKAVTRLVINVDSDQTASGKSLATGLRQGDVLNLVRTLDSKAVVNSDGEIEMDGGATKVSLVRWEVNDAPAPGLPDQQTLERLVSAAMAAAYPARAQSVQKWLDGRPIPPGVDPKEHAWSCMAGWYAEDGCDAFYSNLWSDGAVVAELEARLRSSGAWKIAEMLAS
jgi:hypothetical protein